MKMRSLISLILIIAVIVFGSYVAFFGLSFDYKSFEPLRALSLGTDLEGGNTVVFRLAAQEDDSGNEVVRDAAETQAALQDIMKIIQTRLTAKGLPLAVISAENADEIRVDMNINDTSTMLDPSQITDFLSKAGDLSLQDGEKNVIISREDIASIEVMEDTLGKYVVYLIMTSDATSKLEEVTDAMMDMDSSSRYISVVLDGETVNQMYVSDTITNGICGFTSDFTEYEATYFADLVNSGKYPVAVETADQRDTGAVFGSAAKEAFLVSGLAAAALLIVLLAVFYKVPGLLSAVSLLLYATLSLFFVSLMRIQLTAWGALALLLGLVYMALSHVGIYERCKKEYRSGKNLRASLKTGYSAAGKTVFDLFAVSAILFLILVMSNIGTIMNFSYFFGIALVLSYVITMVFNRLFIRLAVNIAPEKAALYFPIDDQGRGR